MANKAVMAMPYMIRTSLIKQLADKGIENGKDGTSVHKMTQKELARELAMAHYRERNISSPEEKWF